MVKYGKVEIIVKNYIYLFACVSLVLQVLGSQACIAIPGVCGGGGQSQGFLQARQAPHQPTCISGWRSH